MAMGVTSAWMSRDAVKPVYSGVVKSRVQLLRDVVSEALFQEARLAFATRRHELVQQVLLCPSTSEFQTLQQELAVLCRGVTAAKAFDMLSFAGAAVVSAKCRRLEALVGHRDRDGRATSNGGRSRGGVEGRARELHERGDAASLAARQGRPVRSCDDAAAARAAKWWTDHAQSYRVMTLRKVKETFPSLLKDLSAAVHVEVTATDHEPSDQPARRGLGGSVCVDALLTLLAPDVSRIDLLDSSVAELSAAERAHAAGVLVTICFEGGDVIEHASLLMLACLLRTHVGGPRRRDGGSASDSDSRGSGSHGGYDAAVFPDDAAVIHWLVRHGADPLHVVNDGRSAVHFAAERVRALAAGGKADRFASLVYCDAVLGVLRCGGPNSAVGVTDFLGCCWRRDSAGWHTRSCSTSTETVPLSQLPATGC